MLPFKRFLESLSEEKRNLVKELGLGGLLGLNVQQNRNQKIEELIRRFDPETRLLSVHGQQLEITENDVRRIFGLPAGTRDISKLKRNLRELRDRYNLKKEKRKELLRNMETIENNEEWQANFILVAIHCVLRPTSSLNCSPASLDFLDDVSGLQDMNWCKYVLDGLIAGTTDFHNQVKNVEDGLSFSLSLKGCTLLLEVIMQFLKIVFIDGSFVNTCLCTESGVFCHNFLQIFYVEHVKCRFMNIPWGLRSLPRICDWSDERLKKVYAIVNGKLDDCSVIILPIAYGNTICN